MQFDNKLPLRTYSSFEDGTINDFYTQLLSEISIFKEIETDNLKFLQEVEEYTPVKKSRQFLKTTKENSNTSTK